MPGAIAAMHAVKRRGRTKGVSASRVAEMQRMARKAREYAELFRKYDANRNNKLERDEVECLLTDFDTGTPRGTRPTTEEIDFVMKIADKSGDDCLNRQELDAALKAWHVYIRYRPEMAAKMKEFDQSGTGKLSRRELKKYLAALNDGVEVSNADVNFVLKQADSSGDGNISQTELIMATSVWYGYMDHNKDQCCSVM